MTSAELKRYVKYLAIQSGFPMENIDDHVDVIISLGVEAFWEARPWSFRSRQYTMTTGSDKAVALPDDFAGFRSVQERTSSTGWDLEYYIKEEYDSVNPDRLLFGEGSPRMFTVYYDKTNDKWYALFAPHPVSGTSIYWDMLTKWDGGLNAIPGGLYTLGVLSAIGYCLYPVGSPQRMAAYGEFRQILKDIEPEDTPFKGRLFRWKTESETAVDTSWPWV